MHCNMLIIHFIFEKIPIRLVQVMAIFVSGAKRKTNAEEDKEKYKEHKTNFEGTCLKGWTDLAQICMEDFQGMFHRKKTQKKQAISVVAVTEEQITFSWFL